MTGNELIVEAKLVDLDIKVIYSDEFVIGVTEEDDKIILTTTPEPEDGIFNVDDLINALKEVNLELKVFVNEQPLDDVEYFEDFNEFDLYTEDE